MLASVSPIEEADGLLPAQQSRGNAPVEPYFLGIARLMQDCSPSSSPPFALALATLSRDAGGRATLHIAGEAGAATASPGTRPDFFGESEVPPRRGTHRTGRCRSHRRLACRVHAYRVASCCRAVRFRRPGEHVGARIEALGDAALRDRSSTRCSTSRPCRARRPFGPMAATTDAAPVKSISSWLHITRASRSS